MLKAYIAEIKKRAPDSDHSFGFFKQDPAFKAGTKRCAATNLLQVIEGKASIDVLTVFAQTLNNKRLGKIYKEAGTLFPVLQVPQTPAAVPPPHTEMAP